MITIRNYCAEDFNELWRIDQACFVPGIAYSRRELSWYIRRSRAFTLVAADEDEIAGFVVAESDPSGAGHILTIDVRPKAQRQQVGSRLLQAAEDRLLREGCQAVLLETAVDNVPALAFYKRHDYSVLETIPHYYLDDIDALVMGKHLTRIQPKAGRKISHGENQTEL